MQKPALADYLASLKLVVGGPALRADRTCKLCGERAIYFDSVDFHKNCPRLPLPPSRLMVDYYRCERCELLFTDFCDDWSTEDFARYIYNDDYIVVDGEYTGARPIRTADDMSHSLAGAEQARILDFGSGSGIFGQEMMRRGFAHVESYDPFTSAQVPEGRFDIVTCFDVIEHSPDPAGTLQAIMDYVAEDGMALIGQTFQPADIETVRGEWWYIGPRNGHITTYGHETLRLYCAAKGYIYDELNYVALFSRPGRSPLIESLVARHQPRPRRIVFPAPGQEGDRPEWHDIEQGEFGQFRWTGAAHVPLGRIRTPWGACRVVVPFLMAITPDFVESVTISVGPFTAPVRLRNGELVAQFDFEHGADLDVGLHTRAPIRPCDLAPSEDDRSLGLAIPCV